MELPVSSKNSNFTFAVEEIEIEDFEKVMKYDWELVRKEKEEKQKKKHDKFLLLISKSVLPPFCP